MSEDDLRAEEKTASVAAALTRDPSFDGPAARAKHHLETLAGNEGDVEAGARARASAVMQKKQDASAATRSEAAGMKSGAAHSHIVPRVTGRLAFLELAEEER